jgi:hypothetical protein
MALGDEVTRIRIRRGGRLILFAALFVGSGRGMVLRRFDDFMEA